MTTPSNPPGPQDTPWPSSESFSQHLSQSQFSSQTQFFAAQQGGSASPFSFVIFSDDWGRHPSSCQHLARHLLWRHHILWVNTIGTRAPGLNLATLQRGGDKLKQWLKPLRSNLLTHNHPSINTPWHLRVLNPPMWPWIRRKLDRRINLSLLRRSVEKAIREYPGPKVALTTIPLVADLVGKLPMTRWIYYCVDDFGSWPGLENQALAEMERTLVERVDVVVAAGDVLRDRIRAMGKEAHVLTHGIDLDFWHIPDRGMMPPELEDLEKPFFVWWGLIDARIDVEFIAELSRQLQRGTILLVGPISDPNPGLWSIPRVRHLPPVPMEQLPILARFSAACILPYIDAPVTRAMQPLKLKECLSTQRPVIARDLPAMREWADCLDLASDAHTFAATVRKRLAYGLPPEQTLARVRLENESWSAKADQLLQWCQWERPTPSSGSQFAFPALPPETEFPDSP